MQKGSLTAEMLAMMRFVGSSIKRIRFSLQTLILSITVLALMLGVREHLRSAHMSAIAELEMNGAQLFDSLIDPIGPNWIWTWNVNQSFLAPGYLSSSIGVWFEKSALCTEIRTTCIVNGDSKLEEQLNHLSSLFYLTTLDLRDVQVTEADIRRIAMLRDLRALYIVSDTIDAEIINELKELRQLQSLAIGGANIPDDAEDVLANAIPNCSISVSKNLH